MVRPVRRPFADPFADRSSGSSASPLGQDNRYDLHTLTLGFVPVPRVGHTMQVHPVLPGWMAELEQDFTYRSVVDLLYWFAREPHAPQFAKRTVARIACYDRFVRI